MPSVVDSHVEDRRAQYLKAVGRVLGNKRRSASFAIYASGLMGNGKRKSAEPIAARACGDPALVDAYHQRLTYFLSESEWSDAPVRRFATRYALDAMTAHERVSTWIIEETSFLKQGTHSVGVQRQYSRTAGRVANCQIGVGLSLATPSAHLPIDFELYLPHGWSDEPARRAEAHIPEAVGYRSRPELALQMVRRALANEIPVGVVIADAAYGDSGAFRRELRELGLDYATGVQASTLVWCVDASGARQGQPMTVAEVGRAAKPQLRKVIWGEDGRGQMAAWFAACRVRPVNGETSGADDEEVWLLIEVPSGEPEPRGFWLATLPACTSTEQLVHLIKAQHRTERSYAELRGALGLDHFEGRTYRGWQHHVTVALVCYAFLVAERANQAALRRRLDAEAPWTADTSRTPSPCLLEQSPAVLLSASGDVVGACKAQ